MRRYTVGITAIAALLALEGCVTTPSGPTIPVMPGRNKSFSQFQNDQYRCERYAHDRVAGNVDAANDRIASHVAIGTILGAALGGALGDTRGAVAGGAAGAAIGGGTANPGYSQYSAQQQYNIAYAQCMKYHGNDVNPEYGPRPPRYQRDYRDYPPPPPPPGDGPDDY